MKKPTLVFFFKDFIYLFFREGKGGRKRERETSPCGCFPRAPYWPTTQTYLEWEWNRGPFGLQAGTQSTEPHQTGPWYFFDHLTFSLVSDFGGHSLGLQQ